MVNHQMTLESVPGRLLNNQIALRCDINTSGKHEIPLVATGHHREQKR